MKIDDWELSVGFIPGLLFGMRSYVEKRKTNHVLYFGCVDVCITIYYV
jgi:uncharacterized membrane protein